MRYFELIRTKKQSIIYITVFVIIMKVYSNPEFLGVGGWPVDTSIEANTRHVGQKGLLFEKTLIGG